jgi:hypothetical protein
MKNTKKYQFNLSIFLIIIIISSSALVCNAAAIKNQYSPHLLAHRDAVLITEAYHLWQSLGEKMWTGWTATPTPLIYITSDYEYAINFPKSLTGFKSIEQSAPLDKSVQVRKRTFEPNLAASFSVEDIPAVIIGTPVALEKTPGE